MGNCQRVEFKSKIDFQPQDTASKLKKISPKSLPAVNEFTAM